MTFRALLDASCPKCRACAGQAGLLPGAAVGGGAGPGCFTHTKGIQISTAQLFWWEVRPAVGPA